MKKPEVVITGVGVLACNGIGRNAFWDALNHGRSGIRTIDRFDASDLPCQIAGQLWDFDPADFMKQSDVRNWHRHVHQAVSSAKLAVEDSALNSAGYNPDRMSAAVGTSVGSPSEAYLEQQDVYLANGYKKINRLGSTAFSGHAATVHVTVNFGLRGPAITIASGCATGIDVLSWGYQQIQLDRVDAAVVGATESPIFPMSLASACSLGILSKRNSEPDKAMRPYDRSRDGIVLSEGAVALVLERKDKAIARGAPIYGEILGCGGAADGKNPLILDRDGIGLSRAIGMAVREANIAPHEIEHIQAHGVSLEMYDRSEITAYKRVFGNHSYRMPISAIKSMVGQAYSAGGLQGVAAALMVLHQGIVPPTMNLDDPDPECDLDFVPKRARRNDVSTALVSAISFGGTFSAAVLRRCS
jgi:3-oxoacyl-[acyl-carrier-protein] synthase II